MHRLRHGGRVVLKAERRIVMRRRGEAAPRHQAGQNLRRQADDGDGFAGCRYRLSNDAVTSLPGAT